MGYSPWGRKESDTTEHTHTHKLISYLYFSFIMIFLAGFGIRITMALYDQFWNVYSSILWSNLFRIGVISF